MNMCLLNDGMKWEMQRSFIFVSFSKMSAYNGPCKLLAFEQQRL